MNIHSASLKGLRNQNEDNHEIILNFDKRDPNKAPVDFFAVYDGHGGKQVSNFLKNNLSKFFTDKRVKYPLTKKYVNTVYDTVQQSICKEPYCQHAGSTALVAIKFKHQGDTYLNVINLGDCRAILCRDGQAVGLSKDHKPSWPQEYHRITQMGGKVVFDGYDHRVSDLSVSRAFGDKGAHGVTHVPDLFRYKLDRTDKFLVLCCDGVIDVLRNEDIGNYILFNSYDGTLKNRKQNNVNIAKKLAEHALAKGSTDNLTVLTVFLN